MNLNRQQTRLCQAVEDFRPNDLGLIGGNVVQNRRCNDCVVLAGFKVEMPYIRCLRGHQRTDTRLRGSLIDAFQSHFAQVNCGDAIAGLGQSNRIPPRAGAQVEGPAFSGLHRSSQVNDRLYTRCRCFTVRDVVPVVRFEKGVSSVCHD